MAFGATAVVVGFGDADTMGSGVSDTPAPRPIASAAPSASSTGTVSGHMHGAVRLVRVTSEPTGAHVERDGKRVCEATPCELRLLASDDAKPARLLLRKPGFEPTTVLVAERGQLWVELQPVVPLFEAPPAGSAVVEED